MTDQLTNIINSQMNCIAACTSNAEIDYMLECLGRIPDLPKVEADKLRIKLGDRRVELGQVEQVVKIVKVA